MKIGKACAIFLQIDSDKYTEEEKGQAIFQVVQMPTHNGINKDAMLKVIGWLLRLAYDVPAMSPRGGMNNYDRVMCMTPEKLAEFLKKAEYRPPWDDAFVKAFCYKCKTETVTVTDEPKRTLEVNPCDFTDGECPHGSDITWWLAQRAPTKEGKNREG
ncbi:MAG: hypothetical protein IJU96_01345 [Clostridia bacterium]|nr:hypothetical protein [Clostridia bacterium]